MRWTLIDQTRNGMRLRVALTLEPVTSVDTTGELLDEDGREEPSRVRLRAMPALAKCGDRERLRKASGQ